MENALPILPNLAMNLSYNKYNLNPLENVSTEELIAELERRGVFNNMKDDILNISDYHNSINIDM